MKNRSILNGSTWLLALCLISMLALSACNRGKEHPEHPATNAPPATK